MYRIPTLFAQKNQLGSAGVTTILAYYKATKDQIDAENAATPTAKVIFSPFLRFEGNDAKGVIKPEGLGNVML